MTHTERIIEILQTQMGDRKMQYSKAKPIADALIANDVRVQTHGKWIRKPTGYTEDICSCCFGLSLVDHKTMRAIYTPFCPSCGARMDLEDE